MPETALEIVYQADGTPAFAGQALIIQGCGGGGFCHSPGITPEDRLGVPLGLDFDLRIASTSEEVNAVAVERLGANQLLAVRHAGLLLEVVNQGSMPPQGEVALGVLDSSPRFDRVSPDGASFTPLPRLDTAEGRELLRNWIACRAPVVERTVERTDMDNEVGFTVAACARRCVDPTWTDIYQQIIGPSCAVSACHDADEPVGGLDLSVVSPADPAALEALLQALNTQSASGSFCSDESSPRAGALMIVPSDPDASLLVHKLNPSGVDCGSVMPGSGNPMPEQRLCAIREWVACGACGPSDNSCDACLEAARATCGVETDGDGNPSCVEQVACAGFAEVP